MSCFRKLPFGLILASVLGSASAQVQAQANEPLLDRNLFSIGVGISRNEINSPDEDDTGFQFFAAYDLVEVNLMEGVDSSVEFGFMDFGFDEDDTGIWGSFVVDGDISGGLGWLAQAGYDIGDDSGLLFGAGLKAVLNDRADLRFEYVVRDDVDSLQINVLYHL
jgi:hypothetical protein